jgi:protocatechuate 3,4-dioxygenase beta subunit
MSNLYLPRRQFLTSTAAFAAAAWWTTPGAFAEELTRTARTTEGPFYPDHLPLDTDNDLILLNDNVTPSLGQITHLTGKVLTAAGEPVRNAYVEIWQCDHNGHYIHTDNNFGEEDKNFQGYGRFLTNAKGEYYFRTIKPVPYPGRTPHIHIAVNKNGKRLLTSQIFINGEKQNDKDGVYRQIGDETLKKSVVADFIAIPDSRLNELAANFDIILGVTAIELEGIEGHGLGKPERLMNRRG